MTITSTQIAMVEIATMMTVVVIFFAKLVADRPPAQLQLIHEKDIRIDLEHFLCIH